MDDLKLIDRVGVLDIFGIVSPGVTILLAFMLSVVGLDILFRPGEAAADFKTMSAVLKDWVLLLVTVAFFLAYLYGGVIRLFANDLAEILSGFYMTAIRRKNIPLANERFPYPFAAKSLKDSSAKLFEWYRLDYPFFAEEDTLPEWRRRTYFNMCKVGLYGLSPARAMFYEKIESFVRFLAGALVSNIVLIMVVLPFGVYFALHRFGLLAALYLTIALISGVVIVAILERFRYQHVREVMTLWQSYYQARTADTGSQGVIDIV